MPIIASRAGGSAGAFGGLRSFETPFVYGTSNAFESIATITVTSAALTFAFTSISSSYKHLMVRLMGRNGRTGAASGYLGLQPQEVHADQIQDLTYSGATVTTRSITPTTGDGTIAAAGTSANASNFSPAYIYFWDYTSTTKSKVALSVSQAIHSADNVVGLQTTFIRNSTSALTSIQFIGPDSQNIQVGSQFALYGIKGA
jgi:hypothetical protein